MAQNAIDLCLASTVAADLGISSDATVERCVTAASRAIATYCGRKFEKGTALVEYPAGYGRPVLILSRPPILTITSVVEAGSTLASTEYTVEGELAEAGLLRRVSGVWMFTATVGGRITDVLDAHQGESGSFGITVTYDGGYSTPGQILLAGSGTITLPEDVQEAAIITATQIYRQRGTDANVASESIGDWSVTYAGTNTAIGRGGPIPERAAALLGPYMRPRVS